MQMMPQPRDWTLATVSTSRLDRIGSVLVALVPMAMLAILLLRPSTNSDMFWQLRLGELTLANRGPLMSEPFAVSHLGEPLQNLAWAGQALMALVLDWTGWCGLRLFDALCWAGGFWGVAATCIRRGDRALAVAGGLGLAFIAALPTAILRPQSMASIALGLLLVLLAARIDGRIKVVAGAVLLLVWQNLHPSVSVAFGVLGIHAAAGWWQWWRDRAAAMPIAESALVPIALAAMFCTPDGFSILQASATNGEISLLVGVGEWMPLWAPLNRRVALPIVAAAVLALVALRRFGGRIELGEALTCLALFAMTVLVYRFVLFWAIALVPVIARCGSRDGRAEGQGRPLLSAGLGILAVAIAITAAKPVEFRKHIPLDALAALKRENLAGTVFCDFTLGGAVIWMGYPQWRVAYDGRYYRYTRAEWERFAGIQSGAVGVDELERRYRPVAWVLHPRRNAHLVRQIVGQPARWRRLWADDAAVIFVPAG